MKQVRAFLCRSSLRSSNLLRQTNGSRGRWPKSRISSAESEAEPIGDVTEVTRSSLCSFWNSARQLPRRFSPCEGWIFFTRSELSNTRRLLNQDVDDRRRR